MTDEKLCRTCKWRNIPEDQSHCWGCDGSYYKEDEATTRDWMAERDAVREALMSTARIEEDPVEEIGIDVEPSKVNLTARIYIAIECYKIRHGGEPPCKIFMTEEALQRLPTVKGFWKPVKINGVPFEIIPGDGVHVYLCDSEIHDG